MTAEPPKYTETDLARALAAQRDKCAEAVIREMWLTEGTRRAINLGNIARQAK